MYKNYSNSSDLIEKVIADVLAGDSKKNVSIRYGMSEKTVCRWMRNCGVYKTRKELAIIRSSQRNKSHHNPPSPTIQRTESDITDIVNDYVKGISMRSLVKKYKLGWSTLRKYLIDKGIQIRTPSESAKYIVRKPLSDEHKQKISKSRLEFLMANPDKVPYRLWNSPGYVSYPHRRVCEYLTKSGISGWVIEMQFSIYSFDIAFPDLKLDIEIDGKTHNQPKSILADKRRDEYSKSNGWTVLRFTASQVNSNIIEVMEKIKTTILSIDSNYLSVDSVIKLNNLRDLFSAKYGECEISPVMKIITCEQCGCSFEQRSGIRKNQRYCSAKCVGINKRNTTIKNTSRPSIHKLIDDLRSIGSYTGVGKLYSVSDNCIRKWIRGYGIDPKTINKINKVD